MSETRSEIATRRGVGVLGLVAFVLSAAIGAIPPPPPVGAEASVVLAFFGAHGRQVLVLNHLGALGLLPLQPLVAYTVALVRRREGADGFLWLLLLSMALLVSGGGFTVLALFQGVAYVARSASPELARALADVSALCLGMLFVPIAGFLSAFGAAVLQTRVWPSWLGVASLVAATLALVASLGAIVTDGPLAAGGPVTLAAFGAFLLWMLVYSLLIFVRPPAPGGERGRLE